MEHAPWTMWREVTGYFALWAVRQIEHPDTTPSPPGLESMIGYLSACTRSKFDKQGMAELSLCQIERMLEEILWSEKTFQSWNDREVPPGRLDLYALLRNVCLPSAMSGGSSTASTASLTPRTPNRIGEEYENTAS